MVEVALVFVTQDATISDQLAEMLPDADISIADSFTGTISVAALLTVGKDVLASILGFVVARQGAVKDAKLRFVMTDGSMHKEIELNGYTPDQAGELIDKLKALQAG